MMQNWKNLLGVFKLSYDVKMIVQDPKENYQDYKESFILRSLVDKLGFTAAQSVMTHVCVTTGTSKSELFSNYETFSKLIKQVYGDAGQKHVLDKLQNMQKIINF